MSRTRSNFRKFLIAASALLILLILGAVLVATLGRPAGKLQQVTLKDGRIIELLAVTKGPAHNMPENRLRQLAHAIIPVAMKKAFGPYFGSTFGFNSEGLGLWLMCYDPVAEAYVNGVTTIVAVDEHGCEFESRGNGQTSDGYHKATIYNLPTYPRRGEAIYVRLVDSVAGTNVTVGELRLENPSFGSTFPTWRPESFPVTKTNGPVALRMNEFDPTNGQTVQILGMNGRHHNTHFEDATGNSGTSLCTNEPAWKYCTTVFRTAAGPFTTNELWTVGEIALPAPGKIVSLTATQTVSGQMITVRHFAGAGSYNFSNEVCVSASAWTPGMSGSLNTSTRYDKDRYRVSMASFGSANPFLVVEHSYLPSDMELLLIVRDGERVIATAQGASGAENSWYYPFSWTVPPNELPPDGTTLTLQIAVHQGYKFEFLVNPLHQFGRGMPR
jgi:hypothetical protein